MSERAAGTAARRARLSRPASDEAATAADDEAVDGADRAGGAPQHERTGSRALFDPDRLAALEEERDFLLRSLEDLDREHRAGDVDDADYAALRDDYTGRAAAVLRAIESRGEAMASAAPRRPAGRVAVIAVVVAVAAFGAGLLVARSAEQRQPGDAITGDIRQTTRDRLLDAQRQLGDGQIVEAIKTYDAVLVDEPANAEALTYRGWLLRLVALQTPPGNDRDVLIAGALRSLDAAVTARPDYADARVFRAVVLRDVGRTDDARADLERLRSDDVPVFMLPMVDGLRGDVGLPPLAATPGSVAPGTTR